MPPIRSDNEVDRREIITFIVIFASKQGRQRSYPGGGSGRTKYSHFRIVRSKLQPQPSGRGSAKSPLERFRAKWTPVRVKKTRQTKNLSPVLIQSERKKAL
jgi:hypothetical protein